MARRAQVGRSTQEAQDPALDVVQQLELELHGRAGEGSVANSSSEGIGGARKPTGDIPKLPMNW